MRSLRRRRRKQNQHVVDNGRDGVSLLEVIAASTIAGMTLVPSLRLMRDSLRVSRQLEVRECLATVATGELEHQMQEVASNWQMTSGISTSYGQLTGYPQVVVEFDSSDASVSGGIPGSLAAVSVAAFQDSNANGRRDVDETAVVFHRKVARTQTFRIESRVL